MSNAEEFALQNELKAILIQLSTHLDRVRAAATPLDETEALSLYGQHSNAIRRMLDEGLKLTLVELAGKKPEGLLYIAEDSPEPRVIPMVPDDGERRVAAPPQPSESETPPESEPRRHVLNVLTDNLDMDRAVVEYMRTSRKRPNRAEAREDISQFALLAKIIGLTSR